MPISQESVKIGLRVRVGLDFLLCRHLRFARNEHFCLYVRTKSTFRLAYAQKNTYNVAEEPIA